MLFCLITHLYLINVCLGDGQKHTPLKYLCFKEIGVCLCMLLTTPHSIVNTIGRAYVFCRVNEYALLTIIMNSREFRFESGFCLCFIIDLQMQHICKDIVLTTSNLADVPCPHWIQPRRLQPQQTLFATWPSLCLILYTCCLASTRSWAPAYNIQSKILIRRNGGVKKEHLHICIHYKLLHKEKIIVCICQCCILTT